MATYQREIFIDGEKFSLLDWSVYGSARLGLAQVDDNILWTSGSYDPPTWTAPFLTSKGSSRSYELTNHLGNVLAVVSDLKSYVDTIGSGQPNYWDYSMANILSAQDYYPFGMIMPRRNFATDEYRFSFNGKENDNEVKGVGNSIDFGARIYDPRLGRWLSLDPLSREYPDISPYVYAANNPILFIDKDGMYPIVREVTGVQALIKALTFAEVKDLASLTAYYGGSQTLSVDGKNIGNRRYLYSKSNGWIDMNHVSNAALATDKWYIFGSQVLSKGFEVEKAQEKKEPSSAWSYEDLFSNKLGVEFESYLEDNEGEFLVVLEKFLYEKGFVDNPMEVAPNSVEIPYNYPMDPKTPPTATNKTSVPKYTIPETSGNKQSEKTDEKSKNDNANK